MARADDRLFARAVSDAAADDAVIAAFYRGTGYRSIWTDADDAGRRAAFLSALATAGAHGLPVARYDERALGAAFAAARTDRDRGDIEVRMTRAYLDYAHDLQAGAVVAAKVDPGIVRDAPVFDAPAALDAIAGSDPAAVLRGLAPRSPEYAMLMREKLRLEQLIDRGGWGSTVSSADLGPGRSGAEVVGLRDRLVAMGLMPVSASARYDATLQRAVQEFQYLHGLDADGIADRETLEQINIGPEERLKSVIVAMERERWMNIDRGSRYVWVNLTDFSARIVDHGRITFQTRAVIGKNVPDQRTRNSRTRWSSWSSTRAGMCRVRSPQGNICRC